jgi:hypothetical protein
MGLVFFLNIMGILWNIYWEYYHSWIAPLYTIMGIFILRLIIKLYQTSSNLRCWENKPFI